MCNIPPFPFSLEQYVEVSGLSRNYSEVKIFKSLEKLTSKLGSEIRAIYTNTGTAKLQFKNKVVAERLVCLCVCLLASIFVVES